MRTLIHLSILFLLVADAYGQNSSHLFRIIENGRIGYIDSTGRVVIEPKFKTAGEFSEGLAAARLHGTYGYIDQTGEFVIPAIFDYAEKFSQGVAAVYSNGQLRVIDRTGKLPAKFSRAKFVNGLALIKITNEKIGLIDKGGNVLVDTPYAQISSFTDGLAIVEDSKSKKVGVIDSTGEFRIPLGRFQEVEGYQNGYFRVRLKTDKPNAVSRGFVDTNGQIMFVIENDMSSWIAGYLSNGLATLNLAKADQDNKNTENFYTAYINAWGEVAINDPAYIGGRDFSDNRAFVLKDEAYIMINRKGQKVAGDYTRVQGEGFKNGMALVETKDGWGVIDTNGRYIVKPKFDDVHHAGIVGDYFFFAETDTRDIYRYGVATIKGKIIVPAIIDEVDYGGHHNGLLKCIVGGKLSYFNKSGAKVWQERSNDNRAISHLDIDHMNRGYFIAYSKPEQEHKQSGLGGYFRSDNYPKPIEGKISPRSGLSIQVNTSITDTFAKAYFGHKVLVLN